MNYTKQTWTNGPAGGTPVSAARLAHLETQYDAAVASIPDFGAGWVNANSYGFVGDGIADDTAAIQAALDTGRSVVVSPPSPRTSAVARTSATLLMHATAAGQQLLTQQTVIAPAFVGDVVMVRAKQGVNVAIRGTLQPGSGTYTEVAAIRVGGLKSGTVYNPMQASVAGSDIRDFKGNGIIWDQGAKIDFTDVFVSDVTVDGVRCGGTYDDNNHGHFANMHVIRAGRYGYAFLNGTFASRAHQFVNAKAFNCGQNYRIETSGNAGSVFSELPVSPDQFTSTAKGNDISVIQTETAYESWLDSGSGNRLSGYSSFAEWDTRVHRSRDLRVRTRTQIGSAGGFINTIRTGSYNITTATSIASGASLALTIPGVTGISTKAVGSVTLFGPNADFLMTTVGVGSAGTPRLVVHNVHASAAIDLNGYTVSWVLHQFE